LYSIANGIIALKKHVYANHCMIAKKFETKINNLLKELPEKKLAKKRPHVNGILMFHFFATKDFYKKDDVFAKVIFGRFSFFNCKK
jgi:hypothetical protein